MTIPLETPCIATESMAKVNMSGDAEQYVTNVPKVRPSMHPVHVLCTCAPLMCMACVRAVGERQPVVRRLSLIHI